MSYKARAVPKTVLSAKDRCLGMQKIDTDKAKLINYRPEGVALTTGIMESKIDAHGTLLDAYNTKRKELDRQRIEILRTEKEIGAMASDVLVGGKAIFGQDSNEVELLGGTRTSERKAPRRKTVSPIDGNIKKVA